MLVSWRQKCLLFTFLAFIVLASDASRLPRAYWEQMLPKKLPTPSSSPSKGTNSVSRSYSTTIKSDSDLSSTDGKNLSLMGDEDEELVVENELQERGVKWLRATARRSSCEDEKRCLRELNGHVTIPSLQPHGREKNLSGGAVVDSNFTGSQK
ncbi:hypothetical protein SADUNF_Sadunf05G0134300 [Salix dunnii]|uniref:Uncharacterized protein n=1 Tax=Salix dunnii TaxID=1413687 RepID=A0A835MZF1_9ROSI|nr:hypothetical protein SADUNF_Sadunf05G0134300 [Salix dunnii]